MSFAGRAASFVLRLTKSDRLTLAVYRLCTWPRRRTYAIYGVCSQCRERVIHDA